MQKQEQDGVGVGSLVCPSFNSYSSDGLADVADRVARDKSSGDGHRGGNDNDNYDDGDGSSGNESDFEFVTFRKAADGVFFDGYEGSVFPIFNRDLLTADGNSGREEQEAEEDAMALQFPMRRLLNIGDEDQHHDPPSSSSSEVDELEAIPPGSYCVWTPNPAKASPSRCKKSNSTGSSSSKRWKLFDLLKRSNSSDGKDRDSFVFLTPSSNSAKKEQKTENSKEQGSSDSSKVAGKQRANGSAVARGEKKVPVSAHEAFYVRNRELKKVDKRRSYLPYRQDLVGFCARLNGMARTGFPPSPF
ncbi:hypothetical protein L6164_005121 [Bauhinia variegata]|uniref:Uncharacterized protein n=1 Tax=Bauhinia variegata TaxID=167791 RepID=A0ACB9PQA2_BAUVA|nr:hypothetical protein L6164_005121 [Bauhinia variegata]